MILIILSYNGARDEYLLGTRMMLVRMQVQLVGKMMMMMMISFTITIGMMLMPMQVDLQVHLAPAVWLLV